MDTEHVKRVALHSPLLHRNILTLLHLYSPQSTASYTGFRFFDIKGTYTEYWEKRLDPTQRKPSPISRAPRIHKRVPYRWNSVRNALIAEVARKLRLHREWKKENSKEGRKRNIRLSQSRTIFEGETVAIVGVASNANVALRQIEIIEETPISRILKVDHKLWWSDDTKKYYAFKAKWIPQNPSDSENTARLLNAMDRLLTKVHVDTSRRTMVKRYEEEVRKVNEIGMHSFNYFLHLRDNPEWIAFFSTTLRTTEKIKTIRRILPKENDRLHLPWYVYNETDREKIILLLKGFT